MSFPIPPLGHSDRSEEALMMRVREGDRAAMDELLRRHWSRVVGYASSLGVARDEAEDVAQTIFVRLWEGRLRWKQTGTFRSFLYGVARNLSRNRARPWREVRSPSVEQLADVTPSPEPMSLSDRLYERELQARFREAVANLSPRRREIFILARVHGFSYAEIADSLEISQQTVANQMSTALSMLRADLKPYLRGTEG